MNKSAQKVKRDRREYMKRYRQTKAEERDLRRRRLESLEVKIFNAIDVQANALREVCAGLDSRFRAIEAKIDALKLQQAPAVDSLEVLESESAPAVPQEELQEPPPPPQPEPTASALPTSPRPGWFAAPRFSAESERKE